MDEITYWINTKRAPCLMNYDDLTKKKHEAASSKRVIDSIYSISSDKTLVPFPQKPEKIKLSVVNDGDSVSTKELPIVFIESSNPIENHQTAVVTETAGTSFGSDLYKKKTSVQVMRKRTKYQKVIKEVQHKKNKIDEFTTKKHEALSSKSLIGSCQGSDNTV